ncbi:MAG: hypothetical protein ACI4MF_08870 [Candidatus Faecivicinus sp.]
MRRRKAACALLLLLCAVWLMSAAFCVLYSDHDCPQERCIICPALERCRAVLSETAWAPSGLLLWGILFCGRTVSASIRRGFLALTPVRQKVKLLC